MFSRAVTLHEATVLTPVRRCLLVIGRPDVSAHPHLRRCSRSLLLKMTAKPPASTAPATVVRRKPLLPVGLYQANPARRWRRRECMSQFG